ECRGGEPGPDEPARPVRAGGHRREDRDRRAAAGEHMDLGNHRRAQLAIAARDEGVRGVRARFVGGQGHRRVPRPPRQVRNPRGPAVRRGDRRMAAVHGRQDDRPGRHAVAADAGDERERGGRDRPAVRPAQHPGDRGVGDAVRGAVRHGMGDHAVVHGDRPVQQHQPRGGRAGDRGGAVRDRAGAVRGDSRRHRVQPADAQAESVRVAVGTAGGPVSWDVEPGIGVGGV
ncbi:MAG: Tol-Pal system protein TolQ, partial [uncultured Sphingomonadaceae bacterium]